MATDPVNPKLKKAVAEITMIIEKYDVAACVTLCSGEQSEYLNFIAAPKGPTWSCLLWEPEGIRLRAKGKKDLAERFKINSTVKAIHSFRDILAVQWGLYNDLAALTEKHFEIGHDGSSHLSHEDYLKR